jgi:arylsulfatase A
VEEPIRDHLVICPAQKKNLSIRKGRWMYISSQNDGGFSGTKIGGHLLGGAATHLLTGQVNSDVENGKIKSDAPPAQLYNLETDLKQEVNVYDQHPEIVKELQELLEKIVQ